MVLLPGFEVIQDRSRRILQSLPGRSPGWIERIWNGSLSTICSTIDGKLWPSG
jgi:hypothetical protein